MTNKEFQDKEQEILKRIPPEFHGAISYYARQEGDDYEPNVLTHVEDLVDALEGPIKEFAARIKNGG